MKERFASLDLGGRMMDAMTETASSHAPVLINLL